MHNNLFTTFLLKVASTETCTQHLHARTLKKICKTITHHLSIYRRMKLKQHRSKCQIDIVFYFYCIKFRLILMHVKSLNTWFDLVILTFIYIRFNSRIFEFIVKSLMQNEIQHCHFPTMLLCCIGIGGV